MKIISFNVNGIRAAIKKGLIEWLETDKPDTICLQEIKLSETELVEPKFKELGYYCYWYPAQKRGYSGVAIITKHKPLEVEYGMGIEQHDSEGRVIQAIYKDFTLLCAYFPSGSSGDTRQDVKMEFLSDFTEFIKNNKNKNLIICGDVNICHEAIDIHNPVSNKKSSGFLPEEREWLSSFLKSGYLDTFRELNKEPHNYSWWTYRMGARARNLGWRIDYFLMDKKLKDSLKSAFILPEIVMSDHCPIGIELK